MKALVTGAGGFLGGAIARRLVERGDAVRSLSRREHESCARMGLEQVQGDVADLDVCGRAVEGVDVVFHAAAKVGATGSYQEFHDTNVLGTRHLLDAAEAARVPHFVFTSTPSVVLDGRDVEGADESRPYANDFHSHYPRTKALAEQLVRAAGAGRLRTTCLRPHLVYGPGDTGILPRILRRARDGSLRRLTGPRKKIDVTYIDDAAHAHMLAWDALRKNADRVSAKVYFITSGEPVETWWMIDRLLEAAGEPPLERSISPRLAYALGWLLEKLSRPGAEPRLTRWVVQELATSHWFDIGAARRDLGYEPRVGVAEGLNRLALWCRSPSHPYG